MAGEVVFASAGRRDQLRPMTPAEMIEHEDHVQAVESAISSDCSGDAPSLRLQIVHGLDGPEVLDGPEHGLRDGETLCGVPEAEVFVMRHLFRPAGRFACSDCASVVLNDRN
jgi:hypothetical protein